MSGMGWACRMHTETRNVFTVLVEKSAKTVDHFEDLQWELIPEN